MGIRYGRAGWRPGATGAALGPGGPGATGAALDPCDAALDGGQLAVFGGGAHGAVDRGDDRLQ